MTSTALRAVEELPLPLRLLLGCALAPVLLPIVAALTVVSAGLFFAVEAIACLFALPILPLYCFESLDHRTVNRINPFCILNFEIFSFDEVDW